MLLLLALSAFVTRLISAIAVSLPIALISTVDEREALIAILVKHSKEKFIEGFQQGINP
jgi:hypothetical protein